MVNHFLFLAATEAAAEVEYSGALAPLYEILHKFGVEGPFLVAQIINFLLVAFLLYKFAFKPVLSTIEERQKTISDGLQFSEEAKTKLADSEKQHAATLQKAQQEAQAILTEARNNAKALADKQAEEASARTEEMISKAKQAIELERKKMLSEVREEVTRLVVDTSAKVLSKDLSEEDKSRFSKSASEELSTIGS